MLYLFGIFRLTLAQSACIDGTKGFACNVDGSRYCYNGRLVSQCKDCSSTLNSQCDKKECSLCSQIDKNVGVIENQEILVMPQVYIKGSFINIKVVVSASDEIITRTVYLRNDQDVVVSTAPLMKDPLDTYLFYATIDTSNITVGKYKIDIFLENANKKDQVFMDIKTISIIEGKCNSLISAGDPDKKIDIVFIPSGFTKSDFDENVFQDKVQKAINSFLSIDPFSEYKNAFNFYFIDEEYLYGEEEFKNISEVSKICDDRNDFIVKYMPLGKSGGDSSSGKNINLSESTSAGVILAHEFAHVFGGLNDEYFRGPHVVDSALINCDRVGCPKWCTTYENSERFKNTQCDENTCDVKKGCFDNTDVFLKIKEIPDVCFNHFAFCTQIENKEECNQWGNGRLCTYIDSIDTYAQEAMTYYGSHCIPNTAQDTNIGMVCEDGGGCYQGCSSATTFRQTPYSIMGSGVQPSALFSPYARKHLVSLLNNFSNEIERFEGDLNSDRKVDIFDLVTVARDFGKKGEGFAGDADRDGDVDIFDLVIVAKNFGKKLE